MAHHGHHRHSRIGRFMKNKRRWEISEGNIVDESKSGLPGSVNTIKQPIIAPFDIAESETCNSQTATCSQNVPATSAATLSKRQNAQPTQSVAVETVVQVVDTNSQNLWQSADVDFPMTISDSVFGALTLSGYATPAESSPSPSIPGLSVAQSRNSSTTDNAPQTGRPSIAMSSPRTASGVGSIPRTSTPLAASSSPTPSVTAEYFQASVPFYASNSLTGSFPSSSFTFESSSASLLSSSTSTSSAWGGLETDATTNTVSEITPTSNAHSSGSGSSGASATSKIVGGVVGSVAGLAVLFLLLFYLLRRRKSLQDKGAETLPSSDVGAREVAERRASNDPLFTASYFAPAFMKRWRQSTMTTRTESSIGSNPSERGFQKISGRKIAPVLTHGGDGYGGGLDGDSPTIPDCLIGLSPTSTGGGPLSSPSQGPPPTSPYGVPLDTSVTQEAEENPSPARPPPVRLPVSSSVNFGTPTTVIPPHPVPEPQSALTVAPARPDGLGRSLPSHDGSRGSRFTESLDL